MGAAAALVAAQAVFWLGPLLAPLPAEVIATLGVLLLCAVVAIVAVPLARAPALLAGTLLGAAVVAGALSAAGADAAATPAEALAWGLAGVAFARVLDAPPLAVALPLFVGVVDLVMAQGGAPVVPVGPAPGDLLVLTLPGVGDGQVSGRLGAPDLVFLGAFATYVRLLGLREATTLAAMAAALIAAVVAGPLPVLALLAAGALLPNADRLVALVGDEPPRPV